jgi:HlyD family secretion protein
MLTIRRTWILAAFGALALVGQVGTSDSPLELSGVIGAEEVRLGSEFQGYVSGVNVRPGDVVAQGQVLMILDSSAIQAARQEAQAAVDAGAADLGERRSVPRPEAVAGMRAQVAKAEAEQQAALAAWRAAKETLLDPQDLRERILSAEGQVALAAQNIEVAAADYAQAQSEADAAPWSSPERRILDLEAQARKAALEAARADAHTAQVLLGHLKRMRDTPLALEAMARAAESQHAVTTAGLDVKRAQLNDLLSGSTLQEVSVSEAQLSLAQAQLRLAQAQLARMAIQSPLAGTVVECSMHVGELAMPGATLVTVADLSRLTLEVYVPENRLGEVSVGRGVSVAVDGFPGRSFEGQVVHIASQAQYTPRNVATKEQRVNTVYMVKIRLANSEALLKPGMSADVVFAS